MRAASKGIEPPPQKVSATLGLWPNRAISPSRSPRVSPGLHREPLKRALDFGDLQQRIGKSLDQLAIGQAAQRRLSLRKRRH
jgi:hypothetical protein